MIYAFWWATTLLNTVLTRPSMHVIVVGNGHLSEVNRYAIQDRSISDIVIRFNDMNSWRYGERVDVHVTRLQGGLSPVLPYDAEEWYVTVDPSSAPPRAALVLGVYESSRGPQNTVSSTMRLFSRCNPCPHCAHNWTLLGPSTGAIVLSYLQEDSLVHSIDIFGMNWNGDLPHNDFLDHDIVRRCCLKCTVHVTPDGNYGADWNPIYSMVVCVGVIIVLTSLCLWSIHQNCKRRLAYMTIRRHNESSTMEQKGLEKHFGCHLVP